MPENLFVMDGALRRSNPEEHIRYALRACLLTRKGERQIDRKLGSELHDFMFRPMGMDTSTEIKSRIKSAIAEGEPRVSLLEVELSPDPSDKSQLVVTLKYEVKESKRVERMGFKLRP